MFKKFLPIFICAALLFTGCKQTGGNGSGNGKNPEGDISTATSSMSMKLDGEIAKGNTVKITVNSSDFDTVFSGVCGFQFFIEYSGMKFVNAQIAQLPQGWQSTVTSPDNANGTIKALFDCDFQNDFGNQDIGTFEFEITDDNTNIYIDNIKLVYPDSSNENGFSALTLPDITEFAGNQQ